MLGDLATEITSDHDKSSSSGIMKFKMGLRGKEGKIIRAENIEKSLKQFCCKEEPKNIVKGNRIQIYLLKEVTADNTKMSYPYPNLYLTIILEKFSRAE